MRAQRKIKTDFVYLFISFIAIGTLLMVKFKMAKGNGVNCLNFYRQQDKVVPATYIVYLCWIQKKKSRKVTKKCINKKRERGEEVGR